MFADDTAGLACNDNLTELVSHVNGELKKVARWFRANKMAVNVSKTKYIIFHTGGNPVGNTIKILYDDNEPDENVPERTYELECTNKLERIHNNHAIPADIRHSS